MNLIRTSAPSEDGFTFVEVIVAIAIISITGFILWSGLNGIYETVLKVYKNSRITGELRQLEFLFRKNVDEIEIPYWDSSFEPESDFIFTSQFSYLTLDSIENDKNGMEIKVITADGEIFSIYALYGSFVLMDD